MPLNSPARSRVALFALALGGFGIGTSEFTSMGLLPQVSADLIPSFATAPEPAIAHAALVVSAYALGVVVGAPTIAVFAARVSQTRLTFVLLAALAFGNLVSAMMPSLELTAAARFLAGLPHGAYFGVASLLAARLLGPGRQGLGVAIALSGLTVANIIGVPIGTIAGQTFGWRWAYALVGAIFLATLMLAFLTLPRVPGNPERNPRRELTAFRNGRLWVMVAVASIGFSGFFAVYSYVAETTTRTTGLDPTVVPWVLMVFGIGMTIGNFIGGWLSDRFPARTVFFGFAAYLAALAAYALLAAQPVLLFATAFFVGVTNAILMPAIQSRLIYLAGEAELLGAALNHAAFNIGNALGASLGGLVIAAGLGYLAPAWLGVVMGAIGLLLTLLSFRLGSPAGARQEAQIRDREAEDLRRAELTATGSHRIVGNRGAGDAPRD